MTEPVSAYDNLFFDTLVQGYVKKNPRFLRREWLAKQLDEKLREQGKQFVLLTAEPGAGKSVFMAQLAHDHPDWLRYFIRRDQREVLSDVSARSLLLSIGYQIAAQRPDLFTKRQLTLSVKMRLREVDKGGEAVGVEIDKLIQSPFYKNLGIDVDQQAERIRGKLVAMRINELYIEERLLPDEDLLHLALIDPARALVRIDRSKQIVILIDALDEISYQKKTGDILAWLTKCPKLPGNIRFVLTSRPSDGVLNLFCNGQASRLTQFAIGENDPQVQTDIEQFVKKWTDEPGVAQVINQAGGNPETFATDVTSKAHGNLGYVDALARGVDRAITDMGGIEETNRERGRKTLGALLSLKELPKDQSDLYAFFLNQIKTSVARERIEQKDPQTGETYDKPIWPAVYAPLLGVLAVVMEPVDLDLLTRFGNIRCAHDWVIDALDRLRQFLDNIDGRYRLYHATVAEFLTAEKTRTNPDTTALHQDPVSRNQQIADYYWSRYANDWTTCTEPYGLRHLAHHLLAARDAERAQLLISKTWLLAKRTEGGQALQEFVEDVVLTTQAQLTCASPQMDVLARLLLAKLLVVEDMGNYSDAYLTALVTLNRTGEAIALARMRTEPLAQLQALLAIYRALCAQHVSERGPLRDETSLIDQLEREAKTAEEPIGRALGLAEVAAALAACHPDRSARLFGEAITAFLGAITPVDGIEQRFGRRKMAVFLADAHDSRAEAFFKRAVEAAGRNRDDLQRLAECASHPQLVGYLPMLIEVTQSLESADDTNYVLGWICHAYIENKSFEAAEAVIGKMRRTANTGSWSPCEEVSALCNVASALSESKPERARVLLRKAESASNEEKSPIGRSNGLGKIAALLAVLGDPHADAVFDAAEEAANDKRMPAYNRQKARSRLVPHLARAGRDERVRGLAATIRDTGLKEDMLSSLVSEYVSGRRFDLAEKTACSIATHHRRDSKLHLVCEELVSAELFDDAERVAMLMGHGSHCTDAIAGVIEGLAQKKRFDHAVALAALLPVARSSAHTLASLATHLARAADSRASDLLIRSAEASADAQVQTVAPSHDDALRTMSRSLTRLGKHEAALDVVRLIKGWDAKLNAYFGVIESVRHSNVAMGEKIVAEADLLLEAPISQRKMHFLQDVAMGDTSLVNRNVEKARSRRMLMFAERLVSTGYIQRARGLANSIPQPYERAEALGKVSAASLVAGSRLGASDLRNVRSAAKAASRNLPQLLTSILSEIAGTCTPPAVLVRETLNSIYNIEDDCDRQVELLCKVALSVRQNAKRARSICNEAFKIAQEVQNDGDYPLATVARTFGTLGEYVNAWQAMNEVQNPSIRDGILADLAAGLATEKSLVEARSSLAQVAGLPRVQALAHIASDLALASSPEAGKLFQEAEEAANCISDPDGRSHALVEVVASLIHARMLTQAVAVAETIPKPDVKGDAFRNIANAYTRVSQFSEAFRTLGTWASAPHPDWHSRIDASIEIIASWVEYLERIEAGAGLRALRSMTETAAWLRADWMRVNAIIAAL